MWVTDLALSVLEAIPQPWCGTYCDVSDERSMAALFAEIEQDWGGLDVSCANAGVSGPIAGIEHIEHLDGRLILLHQTF